MKDYFKIFSLYLGVFVSLSLYSNSHKIEANLRCHFNIPDLEKTRDYSCYPLTKEEIIERIENEKSIFESLRELNQLTNKRIKL